MTNTGILKETTERKGYAEKIYVKKRGNENSSRAVNVV
tara:strand:- start:4749 stop:4862 length:114 start_codon:yes stop_codon:yes gene_type:complete